jgi:SCY1-like protein 1
MDPANVERCVNNVIQEDGSNCSIFSFDVTANKARLPMARNAVRKLRTLRHPGVIKVLDTVEVWILEGDMMKKKLLILR